MVDLDYLNQ